MKDLLKKLIKLAEEWRDFSRSVNGWDYHKYLDDHVTCYFAVDAKHAAVTFTLRDKTQCFDGIQVAFHSEPIINGFTLRSVAFIEQAIVRYTEALEKLKVEYAGRDQIQAAKEKAARIKGLKRQLKELEG
jgi:hypothetical protein